MGRPALAAVKTDTRQASTDADVRQILEEERLQEQALAQARRQASELIEQARATARRIEARADQRVRRVHEIGDRLIEQRLQAVEQGLQRAVRQSDRTLPGAAAWEQAIERTARRLIDLPPIPTAAAGDPDGRS